jgi:L-ascorbate metabolism protein UlaG (beta-lactamase superfamily)
MGRQNRYYRGPPAENFDGTRFFLDGHQGTSARDYFKWNLTGSPKPWPRRIRNRSYAPPPVRVAGGIMSCTWIGHSTLLIQTQGLNILTDPFFSNRASPSQLIGPKRVRPPGLTLEALPPIDLVLVSHNHYDHLDLPSLQSINRRWACRIVTPLGNAAILTAGMADARIEELDWWQATDAGDVEIIVTPAFHWSKRTLFDANHALWGAFALKTRAGLIYFAGDTGFGDGRTFREIRERLGAPRLSFLPIGAYEPRWFMKHVHVNPEEAVLAHQLLGSTTSIAIHHSTIRLTDEGFDDPVNAHCEAIRKHHVAPDAFRIVDVGETLTIP